MPPAPSGTASIPPGIGDLPRLERWLAAHGLAARVERIRLIAGGRSNLTYEVTTSEGTLVLRRPPLGHVLPTAHDMSREFRVLLALKDTGIPVATPRAHCDEEEVIGAPFYLMDYVEGHILRTREQAAELLTPDAAGRLSQELAVMLAKIHTVDTAAAGLSTLGRGKGFLRRQLDRWQQQWRLSATREVPGYDDLVARLTRLLPDRERDEDVTLVHGDFRLDNAIVSATPVPRIEAVVDWEMATLGDPLADLGLTLVYWTEQGEAGYGADATTAPGFWTRQRFAAEYARHTGRDVSGIGYYMAFAYFKLAVVLEGINARYLKRQTVGEDFDREGRAVPQLIGRAHEILSDQGA